MRKTVHSRRHKRTKGIIDPLAYIAPSWVGEGRRHGEIWWENVLVSEIESFSPAQRALQIRSQRALERKTDSSAPFRCRLVTADQVIDEFDPIVEVM